jgi:pimeloyl-ACP methyl ester carboxylesterase
MATYVLIPGAGSGAWYWHRVVPLLEARGHEAIAVQLPNGDDSAGLAEYASAVVEAARVRTGDDVIVVAQSMGGFTAPLVADRLPVKLIVLVAAMVPAPHEVPSDWWVNTGSTGIDRPDDIVELFFHDVPADIVAEAMTQPYEQSDTPFEKPWPLAAWPDVPTRFLLCRDDRMFPADFQRRVVKERLGMTPDEMSGGHLPALAHPEELVEWLEKFRVDAAV